MPNTHRSITQSALAVAAVALSLSAIAAPVGPLKVTKTYIDAGTLSGAPLSGGTYTTVGTPVDVTCTVAEGCTVAASLMTQLAQVGGTVALCFYVDGSSVNCPSDRFSDTTGFKVLYQQSSTHITPNIKHKLEMRAYSENPSQLYRFQAEYRMYNK